MKSAVTLIGKNVSLNLKPVLEGVGFNRRPYTDLLDFYYNIQKGDSNFYLLTIFYTVLLEYSAEDPEYKNHADIRFKSFPKRYKLN